MTDQLPTPQQVIPQPNGTQLPAPVPAAPTPVGPKPIVFLIPGPSTMPLIPSLQAAGFDIVVPGRADAQRIGPNVGALEQLLDDNLSGEAVSVATLLSAQVVGALGEGTIPQRLQQQMAGLPLSQPNGSGPTSTISQAILGPLLNWFPAFVHQSMSRQIAWLKTMERMCKLRDVRAVVVYNDVEETTKLACLFASAHGIPSVHVPHAVYLDWGHGPLSYDVHDVVSADWVCCAGWWQAEWYKARGARKVSVTGLPQWDVHLRWVMERDRAVTCRRLKLDEKKKVLVYFSSWQQDTAAQGFHDGIEVAYRALLEIAKGADWQLLVKTHPNARAENMEWHGKMAHDAGIKCLVMDRYYDMCLQAADVAVAYGTSATVMEAALYGTPVVSVAGFDSDDAVITCGDSPQALQDAVNMAFSDVWAAKYAELRPRFIEKYAGRVDGLATQRVLEHVVRLASKGKV